MAKIVEFHDHLMGEGAATLAPQASRRPTPRAAALGTQQRAAEHSPRAPAQVAPSEPLAAARELLRNPPELAVSPDVMRQWRDDIDCLIILAQATPGSTGTGSGERRRQGGAPTSARFPTVGSVRTTDLRAELNRRHAGEDARVSMERARERRLNIEGRNLNADLGAAAPRSQGHIQTPVAGVGCVALAEHLRAVA